jgi:hypothetical protein
MTPSGIDNAVSPTTAPPPDPSRSDITVDSLAYVDVTFCTRHDSYNNVLTFGTPYGEYHVVLPAVGIGAGNYEVGYESIASYFLLLNVAPGRVSCFTHRIATLFSCTWIIAAPVSHMHSKQQ